MASPRTRRPPEDKIERRVYDLQDVKVETRTAADGSEQTVLSGYAAVWDQMSVDLGGFREIVRDTAFDDALANNADVRLLINHDSNLVLGRTRSGTCTLSKDDVGLRFECVAPDTTYARDLEEVMRRKDVDQCSFGFRAREDAWTSTDSVSGLPVRDLLRADLFDVSIVTFPAYPQTTSEVRDAAGIKILEALTPLQRAACEKLGADPEAELTEEERAACDEIVDGIRDALGLQLPEPAATDDLEPEERDGNDKLAALDAAALDLLDSLGEELIGAELAEKVRTAREALPAAEPDPEDREGKVLSQANRDALSTAHRSIRDGADAIEELLDTTLGEDPYIGISSAPGGTTRGRPDFIAYRSKLVAERDAAIAEGRDWGYSDDWDVYVLTGMIAMGSSFMVCMETGDPRLQTMHGVLEQLTALLNAVLAAAVVPEPEENADPEDDLDEYAEREQNEQMRRRLTVLEHA